MNFQIETDSKGNPFLSQCTIYHFYGKKKRDFFSLWVQQDYVVKAPPTQSIYSHQHIQEAINSLKLKGYNYEII